MHSSKKMAVSTAPVVVTWVHAVKSILWGDGVMDFSTEPNTQALAQKLEAFIERYVLPYNPAWHHAVALGEYPPHFVEDLKALAKEAGLWNIFFTRSGSVRTRHSFESFGVCALGRNDGQVALVCRGVQLPSPRFWQHGFAASIWLESAKGSVANTTSKWRNALCLCHVRARCGIFGPNQFANHCA